MRKKINDQSQRIRKRLLDGMCHIAENIDGYYDFFINTESSLKVFSTIYFVGNYCPTGFKPGVVDKFLFNKIIDDVFAREPIIASLTGLYKFNQVRRSRDIGSNILSAYYYPYFSWCDEAELKKAKGEIK